MKQAVVRLLITVVAFASIICTPTYAYFCPCCNDTSLPGCFEEAETLCNEVVSYGNFSCTQDNTSDRIKETQPRSFLNLPKFPRIYQTLR